jgi:hypothetical protein
MPGVVKARRDWRDAIRQLVLFMGAYGAYEIVRGVAAQTGRTPFANAAGVIDFERSLHVFVEPAVQRWATAHRVLIVIADWTYVNAHIVITIGALAYVYARRGGEFARMRNTFLIAMAIALVGYALYPTAPPRLMTAWGFSDSIRQFTGMNLETGPAGSFLNFYAAIPSMHVCFAIMVGWPMARLSRNVFARAAWYLYPLYITFVVVATGNHYLTDTVLGALTAFTASAIARELATRTPQTA